MPQLPQTFVLAAKVPKNYQLASLAYISDTLCNQLGQVVNFVSLFSSSAYL